MWIFVTGIFRLFENFGLIERFISASFKPPAKRLSVADLPLISSLFK